MNFEEALKVELFEIPQLRSKVFPLNAREGIKSPYLVYVSNEGLKDNSLDGYLSLKEVPVELNIVNQDYEGMKDLTKLVLDKILTFRGRKIGGSNILIENVVYSTPMELYENEIKAYRSLLEFRLKFKEE